MNPIPLPPRSHDSTRRPWLRELLAALVLCGAGSALAQGRVDPVGCWAASAPATLAEAQACQAHPGCALVLAASAFSSSCEAAKAWLDRLAPIRAARGRITNSAVMTAAGPVLRPIPGLVSKVETVRSEVEGAPDPGTPLRSRAGSSMYYEGAVNNGLPEGLGTLISASGAMSRGTFVAGRLFGNGQTLHPRGAVFVGSMWESQLQGEGALQLPDGLVMVGFFEDYKPDSVTETFYPDGRSQKAFFSEPGKLRIAGPMAGPGETAAEPDQAIVMAALTLSLECMKETPFTIDPQEAVLKLRELVKGPCGADPKTVKDLARAEKEARSAALQERERAAQDAAAREQADAERSAMIGNFLGQVSSMFGNFQAGQQRAAVGAALAAATTQPAQAPVPGTVSAPSAPPPTATANQASATHRPTGMVAVPAVPNCAVYSLLPREFGRAYFQVHNACSHGIEVYMKIEVDGQWTTHADMNAGIGPGRTLKSNGGIPASGTFQPTQMAVCPSKDHMERQLGARLAGVYTRNGSQWGCWAQYENTGVGRGN